MYDDLLRLRTWRSDEIICTKAATPLIRSRIGPCQKRGLDMRMGGKQPKRVGLAPGPAGNRTSSWRVSEWVGNLAEPIESDNLFGGSAVEMHQDTSQSHLGPSMFRTV